MKMYQFSCLDLKDYLTPNYVNKLNEKQQYLELQMVKDNVN